MIGSSNKLMPPKQLARQGPRSARSALIAGLNACFAPEAGSDLAPGSGPSWVGPALGLNWTGDVRLLRFDMNTGGGLAISALRHLFAGRRELGMRRTTARRALKLRSSL